MLCPWTYCYRPSFYKVKIAINMLAIFCSYSFMKPFFENVPVVLLFKTYL